jgi:hypothetical protein
LFSIGDADEDNNKDRNGGEGEEHTVPTKNLGGVNAESSEQNQLYLREGRHPASTTTSIAGTDHH